MSTPAVSTDISTTTDFWGTLNAAFNPVDIVEQAASAAEGLSQSGLVGLLGYVSPAAKAAGQAQTEAQLVQAGMDPTTAKAVADSTWTQVLTQAGSDPSQMPWYVQNIKLIIVLIGIGLALYLIAPFARR